MTPWTATHQASLSFTVSLSLLKLMSIESVMSFNHLISCHPLFLLPSICPSIRVFSSESALLIMWPKYWSFSTSSSIEYSGFTIDWFDLLAVQGTPKGLLQNHSLKMHSLLLSLIYGPTPTFIHEGIQPVHSEGDQPWDFFGRNDAEAETPVLWPPHAKS